MPLPQEPAYLQAVLKTVDDRLLRRIVAGEYETHTLARRNLIRVGLSPGVREQVDSALGTAWNRLVGFLYFERRWSPSQMRIDIATTIGNREMSHPGSQYFAEYAAREVEQRNQLRKLQEQKVDVLLWMRAASYVDQSNTGIIESRFAPPFRWGPVSGSFDRPDPLDRVWDSLLRQALGRVAI